MQVFISWSGEFSRKVAERLSVWIQTTIQTVDVFYSPEDIEKGENWGNRLSEKLEQSNFGIVCLTPENVAAPWIHFEAGALSKAANSRVSAIMLGISPSDIKGPLARLQNTAFNRDDFFRLLQSINNSSDKPLKQEILESAFNNSWGNLMNDIKPIIDSYTSRTSAPKENAALHDECDSDSDAIQEILRIVRNLDNGRNSPVSSSTSASSTTVNNLSECPEPTTTITLTGSQSGIIKAMTVVQKYGRPVSAAVRIDDNIYRYTVQIPTVLLSNVQKDLKEFAPNVTAAI